MQNKRLFKVKGININMKISSNKKVVNFFKVFLFVIVLSGIVFATTTISDTQITTSDIVVTGQVNASEFCIGDDCISLGGANGYFYNKTSITYLANLSGGGYVGYKAGNYLCDQEFSGSHLCYESEVISTIYYSNISTIDEWTGSAWLITGGAKYSPTTLPVDDCNGFKHGVAGTYLGSFWEFNQTDGGHGAIAHCGNQIALACCKTGGR